MVFRNGLISFLIVIVTALTLITVGIILLVKFKGGANTIMITSISMIVIGLIMILFSKKVCLGNIKLKENINLIPMKELQISSQVKSLKDNIGGIDSFSSFNVNTVDGVNTAVPVKRTDGIVEMLTGVDSKGSRLEIRTCVYDTFENACKSYNSDFKYHGKEQGILDSGGNESNRYFITYTNQLRASAESLYLLDESYITYVFFQKNNIIISLWEMRGQSESKIEKYIQLLADRLSKLE